MAVAFRDLAVFDLEEIGTFIARDNPRRAETFVNEIIERCMRIADKPYAMRTRPEVAEELRIVVFGAYLILYAVENEDVVVLRVVHGSRDIGSLEL